VRAPGVPGEVAAPAVPARPHAAGASPSRPLTGDRAARLPGADPSRPLTAPIASDLNKTCQKSATLGSACRAEWVDVGRRGCRGGLRSAG